MYVLFRCLSAVDFSALPDCVPILHAGFTSSPPASNSLKPSCQESVFGIHMWYGTDSFPKATFLIFYACDLFQCNFIVLKITLIFSKYLQDIMQINRALWQNLGSLGSWMCNLRQLQQENRGNLHHIHVCFLLLKNY